MANDVKAILLPKHCGQSGESLNDLDGFPIKADWIVSKCGQRYRQSEDKTFRMNALADLYTAVDPGGGLINSGKQAEVQERCERLINELAVELVGGIPEGVEQYT